MMTYPPIDPSEASPVDDPSGEEAQHRHTPLVAPSFAMDKAGREILRFYMDRIVSHEEAVLQGWDVEATHDMRVASRRLRVAFRVLTKTFGKQTLSRFRKQFRRLGQVLGAVRDLDVFVEFVEAYAKEHTDQSDVGLQTLRSHLEAEREEPRTVLSTYLQRKRYAQFEQDFQAWLTGKFKGKRKKMGKRREDK